MVCRRSPALAGDRVITQLRPLIRDTFDVGEGARIPGHGRPWRFMGVTPDGGAGLRPDGLRAARSSWSSWQEGGASDRYEGTSASPKAGFASSWLRACRGPVPTADRLPPIASARQLSVSVGPRGEVVALHGRRAAGFLPGENAWLPLGEGVRGAQFVGTDGDVLLDLGRHGMSVRNLYSFDSAPVLNAFWRKQLKDGLEPMIWNVAAHPVVARMCATARLRSGRHHLMHANVESGEVALGRMLRAATTALAVDATGQYLVVGHDQGRVEVQPFSDPNGPVRVLQAEKRTQRRSSFARGTGWHVPVRSLAMHPEAPEVSVLTGDGTIATYDLETGRALGPEQRPYGNSQRAIAYNPWDGALVGLLDGGILHEIPAGGRGAHRPLCGPSPVGESYSIAFHPEGQFFLTAHEDGLVRVFDARNYEPWQA